MITPEEICARIHRLLEGFPRLKDPSQVEFKNGLYFFYEKGEASLHAPKGRVVRVGNHPHSQNGLIKRLRQHYRDNKNSSVFRLLIGGAILRRANQSDPCLAHWEKHRVKTCEKCKPIEAKVTELLKENFSFCCIKVEDRNERNALEKKLIAILSLCSVCKPSDNWLGRFTYAVDVRSSGLWNSDYTLDKNLLGEAWLERLLTYSLR